MRELIIANNIIGGNMTSDSVLFDSILKAPTYSHLLNHKQVTLPSFFSFLSFQLSQLTQAQIYQAITEHLKVHPDKQTLENLLKEEEFFNKVQKYLQLQQELSSKIAEYEKKKPDKERVSQSIQAVNKKITRAALARRHEKNQEEMRKDQIFIRLVPKSQSCIQFMLCNRNFPRMEVKLSCNQHLQYLVNYLTNKWIRGKVGYKVVLYPDSSFLKSMPLSQKQKALKEPFNNYLMFTDIMTCCGVNQNGVLNMTYQIMQTKKTNIKNTTQVVTESIKESQASQIFHSNTDGGMGINFSSNLQPGKLKNDFHGLMREKNLKSEEKHQNSLIKNNSPGKYSYKDDFIPQCSLFNKNSNFFHNEESMFGSLGFNFNFGINKKDDPLFSLNSNHFFDSYFPDIKKTKDDKGQEQKQIRFKIEEGLQERQDKSQGNFSQRLRAAQSQAKREHSINREKEPNRTPDKENSRQKENQGDKGLKEDPDKKLGTLMNILDQIEKQKDLKGQQQLGVVAQEGNNSNRFKDVKTVSIVKKRTTNS